MFIKYVLELAFCKRKGSTFYKPSITGDVKIFYRHIVLQGFKLATGCTSCLIGVLLTQTRSLLAEEALHKLLLRPLVLFVAAMVPRRHRLLEVRHIGACVITVTHLWTHVHGPSSRAPSDLMDRRHHELQSSGVEAR